MNLRKYLIKLYSRIFARTYFYNFNVLLYNMSIRGLGVYSHKSGEYFFYRNLLPNILKNSKPVIFDVGANIGSKTLLFKKLFPQSRIYSFEPNPKCFEKLRVINQENIKLFPLALGIKKEKIKLYDRESPGTTKHSSLYKEVITECHHSEFVEFDVHVETLDTICKQEGIEYIDFIKIDTEGNDFFVLQGAKELLSKGGIKCIQFEFNIMNTVSRIFFRDFIQLLKGYRLYRMLPNGIVKLNSNITHTEIYGLQNVVAILEENKVSSGKSEP